MNLCLCEFMYPISLRNFSHIQERLLQPLYNFLGVRRKTVGLPGPMNPAGKLSGGWLPRDAQHMMFREEMRCCLGSSLQWLLLPLHFRIRLSTAGLHMELGHMLVSAQLGTSIALPCLLRGGRHGRLPLLTWRRGLEWWGRLLPCRKPRLFFFFSNSAWVSFYQVFGRVFSNPTSHTAGEGILCWQYVEQVVTVHRYLFLFYRSEGGLLLPHGLKR